MASQPISVADEWLHRAPRKFRMELSEITRTGANGDWVEPLVRISIDDQCSHTFMLAQAMLIAIYLDKWHSGWRDEMSFTLQDAEWKD